MRLAGSFGSQHVREEGFNANTSVEKVTSTYRYCSPDIKHDEERLDVTALAQEVGATVQEAGYVFMGRWRSKLGQHCQRY